MFCVFLQTKPEICDKVAGGGVGLQGAVGGVQLAGGVIVAQAPHYAGDNDGESDEDSDVSYTQTLSTVLHYTILHTCTYPKCFTNLLFFLFL